jgi:periplasmic divalent cation tolerance protein
MSDVIVVFIMTASEDEAMKIGRALVERKLAACTNILPGIRSLFRWKGEMCDEREVLVIAKSVREKFGELARVVKDLHSYEVPEIIALPVVDGLEEYVKWVVDSTSDMEH